MAQDRGTRSELLDVLRGLVEIDSANPPGREAAMARAVGRFLAERGIEHEVDEFDDGRANIIGRVRSPCADRPALVFSGHLDTVPPGESSWTRSPFRAEVVGDLVYGLGTSDMKGGLAAMIVAAGRVAAGALPLAGDLILAFTAGEEVDSVGAWRYARTLDAGSLQGVVIGEPTDNRLMFVEKGALWLGVTVHGMAAHAARPDLGHNAIMGLHRFIGDLTSRSLVHEPHELLGGSTISVTTISGGAKTNVIPDSCELTIDIRTVPGQDHAAIKEYVGTSLRLALEGVGSFTSEITVLNDRASVATDSEHPFVATARDVLKSVGGPLQREGFWGYSDAAVYSSLYPTLPFVMCGPGRAESCHMPDEYADLHELERGVEFFRHLALRCLT